MLVPLSEDVRLSLVTPRELQIREGEHLDWNEVTTIRRGERRSVSLNIRVAAGGHGQMLRTFEVPAGARLTIYHQVRIEAGGSWHNVICVRGGGEVTVRRAIEVFGVGAQAKIACLGVMEGSGRISVSDEIFSHAEKTNNDIRTKIVLDNAARSEVRGRMVIDALSSLSSSYEKLEHLIFGDQASAVAIPELEVMTDNVKCGHGATTSRPGESELFYLTSRGLSSKQAEKLLAKGFIAAELRGLPDDEVVEALKVLFN